MKWLTFRDHKWLILKKAVWSWNMNITFLQGKGFDMKRPEIVDYRSSESFGFCPIMKNTIIIHGRPERAFFLFRKWKGGRDDESILKEKWLTFHDHKWLTFKRPLTAGIEDLHFYDLKHSMLSRIAAQGASVFQLKCISNHSSTTSLEKYIKKDALKESARKFLE